MLGVMYSVPAATALELGCTLAEAPLGGRIGEYVMEDEIVPREHEQLRIQRLPDEFYEGNNLLPANIDVALARAYPSPKAFAESWQKREWSEKEMFFGSMGSKMTTELER